MAELFIGAAVGTGFFSLVRYCRSNNLILSWWKWLLTVAGFVYAVFVAEVIVSFLREGSPKAAAVNGAILGFIAAIWAVSLARFAFTKAKTEK